MTTPSYTVTGGITTATDYRLVVTCANGGADTSNVVSIAIAPFYNCYCTPSSNCANEGIVNVTMGTLNNSSPMCSGGYSDYTGLGSQVTVTQGQQIGISVTDTINSNPASAGVWIDYDHSSTFDVSEFTFLGSTSSFSGTQTSHTFTANINIPAGAMTGVTAMRVRAANSSTAVSAGGTNGPCGTRRTGEYEDYLITINAGTLCNSQPAGGTVSSSVSSMACPTEFILSASGYTSGVTGLSFQWQESMDNVNFSNLGSASADYRNDTIASITQTRYYRLQVTCTNGTGLVAYSDTATVAFTPINTFPWVYDVEAQNTTTNSNITKDCLSSSPSNTTSSFRWDVDASGGTPSANTGPSGAFSGSKYYYTEASNGTQGDSAKLAMPFFDISSLAVPQLAFYYHMYGATTGKLIIQVNNGSGWVSLDSLVGQQQTAMANPWLFKTVSLSGYSGTVTMRFTGVRGTGYTGDMSLDNIMVRETPTCPAPQAPTVSNVTAMTADLDWTASGSAFQWEIEYGTGNSFALGTGTREIANSKPHTLGLATPLAPSTQYTYFVRGICGANDTSAWSFRSPMFTTLATCDTPTAPTASNLTTTTADLAWTDNAGASQWEIEYGQGNSFALGTGTREIVFSNPTTLGGTTPLMPSTQYTYFVRAICGSNDSSTWSVRSPLFATLATCDTPTAPTATNITTTSADLGWTDNAGASQWEIEYGLGNFAIGSGTRMMVSSNPFTLGNTTPLQHSTSYSYFVRAVCAAGDTSKWSPRKAFVTLCMAATAPYAQTFDMSSAPNCWTSSTTPESWLFANASSGGPNYGVGGSADHTGNGGFFAWVDGSGNGTNQNITLTSAEIDITGFTSPNLSYFMKSSNNNDGALNKLTVDIYDGTTWMQIDSVQQNYPDANWYNRQVALPALSTNIIQLRFVVDEGNGVGSAYFNDILIDDMHITNGPLAVKLAGIAAVNAGSVNRIVWNTSAEESSDVFELQRSADGKGFHTIYERRANGEPSRYTYMDHDPVKGMNYYRLRMTEANGHATFSETVTAFVKSSGFDVQVFPNPVSQELTVKVSGVQGADAAVQVMDVTGKVIRTVEMNGSVELIDMSGLANGIYLIRYSDASHAQIIKVNKQ